MAEKADVQADIDPASFALEADVLAAAYYLRNGPEIDYRKMSELLTLRTTFLNHLLHEASYAQERRERANRSNESRPEPPLATTQDASPDA